MSQAGRQGREHARPCRSQQAFTFISSTKGTAWRDLGSECMM